MNMKYSLLTVLFIISVVYLGAQDVGFNYQGVLRTADGQAMANTGLELIFTMTDGENGPTLYQESHSLTSNEFGLIQTIIGTGAPESGAIVDIKGLPDVFVNLQVQFDGSTDVVDLGNSKLGAVPFALYGEDDDSDPENEMQELTLNGDSLMISDMGGVSLETLASPWEHSSDSNAYFLPFDPIPEQRNDERNGIEFKYRNGTIVQTTQFDENRDALFILRDKYMFEDLPFLLRKAYNRMTLYIHEEFGLDISPMDLRIDANFSVRDDAVREFKLFVTLGDERNTKIWIENDAFLGKLDLIYSDDTRKIKLDGRISDDCGAFALSIGSIEQLGIMESFIEVDGERKTLDPNSFGNQYWAKETLPEKCPAIKFEKNDTEGSTHLSLHAEVENNNCYHVNATKAGVENVLFGNTLDVIASLFAGDNAGWTLTGNGCSAVGDCKNILLVNDNGQRSAPFASSLLSSNSDLSGVLQLNGTQSGNVQLTSLSGFPNNGYLLVLDKSNQNKAGIFVNEDDQGILYGSNINAIVHRESNNETVYSAIVGDESAAYTRGTSRLTDGEAMVICPDHFQDIADPNSMTVTLTPLSGESLGIAVVEKFPGGFKVKELHSGQGNYDFDYMVSCKRKGVEQEVVRRHSPAPNAVKDQAIEKTLKEFHRSNIKQK